MGEPDSPDALPPQTMLLEYQLESVLGTGGFGITYLALDTLLQKRVAIKEYLPGELALRALDGGVVPVNTDSEYNYKWGLTRFLDEARTLARFDHPNIVRVSRYFEANGSGYMVMNYEKGELLGESLRRAPQPEEAVIKRILLPLLDGLQVVHREGFLHLDIKPNNILIREDGSPVLLDFGAARLAIGDAMQIGASVLTPGYSPPEQYSRNGRQGPWSDIYALAGVLYRAVTSEHPLDAASRLKKDNMEKKLGAARVRYSGPFIAAIEWGLALDTRRRPKNVDEWRGALLRNPQQKGGAAEVPAGDSPDAASRVGRNAKMFWIALGMLVFFVFVESTDMLKQHAAEERVTIPPQSVAGPPAPDIKSGADVDARFQQADTDSSGGLSREEVTARLPELAGKFDEIDTDRDGRITIQELQSYWDRNPVPQSAAQVPQGNR
jgi:serine/threonine protein kinase